MFPVTIQLGERTKATLACKKGCSHCCSMRVTTNPPEALAIAEHLRSRDGGVQDVVERLRAYDAMTEVSPDERLFQIMDCPFLAQDLCTVYSHRPKTCRSYHSFDVLRCIADKRDPRAMAGVPQDPMRRDLGDAVFDAMGEACETLGLEFRLLELVPALLIALETPDAARRWLSGERVFSGAHNPDLIARSLAATDRMNARE
jgi:Fe-S-cluster containining protein